MEKRPLGRTGLSIAPLVLGGNVFGWTADEAASFGILDRFVDSGLDAIDTADAYSRWVPGHQGGESETIIGKWMRERGNRGRITLITKVGSDMGSGRKDLSKAYILKAVEDSLRRLQTDVIDLYLSHWPVDDVPHEETLSAYETLIRHGKVRAIGCSNFDADQLSEALAVSKTGGLPRYEVLQPEYNLYDRSGFEGPLQNIVVSEGLGAICYYGLASGFLTGKYRAQEDLGQSPRGGRMERYMNPRGFAVLAALDAVAHKQGATQAEVALAWLMRKPGITAPIASASRPEQADSLVKAVSLHLDDEDMASLDRSGV